MTTYDSMKSRRRKVALSVTVDEDVRDAVSDTATRQRTNVSSLVNYTLAERFIGDQSRDPHEAEPAEPKKGRKP